MSIILEKRSSIIKYAVGGCIAASLLFWLSHAVRHYAAIQDRIDSIAAGCRPVVAAQAKLLTDKYPGISWTIDNISVVGDITTDQPDLNDCLVSMKFDLGTHQLDSEMWQVAAMTGSFALTSAKFMGVETTKFK